MTTKLSSQYVETTSSVYRVVTYIWGLLTKNSYSTLIRWSLQGHVISENYYISTTRILMVIKLGKMVTYLTGSYP